MEVEFGIHLDVEVFSIGKDVNAFLDLSIQTFLVSSLNFNFKATVFLNFLWMEIVIVSLEIVIIIVTKSLNDPLKPSSPKNWLGGQEEQGHGVVPLDPGGYQQPTTFILEVGSNN